MANEKWYSQIHKANLRTLGWCVFLCLKIICGFEISAAHQCQGCVNRSNVRADMMGSHSHLYVLHCDCVVFSVYLSSSYFCSVMYDSLEGTLSQHFPGHHHKSKKKKKRTNVAWRKQVARIEVNTGCVNRRTGLWKLLFLRWPLPYGLPTSEWLCGCGTHPWFSFPSTIWVWANICSANHMALIYLKEDHWSKAKFVTCGVMSQNNSPAVSLGEGCLHGA